MLGNKHCEMLLPTRGSAIKQVGNGPGQFLGSYEANWVHTTHLVPVLIKFGIHHPPKKKIKSRDNGDPWCVRTWAAKFGQSPLLARLGLSRSIKFGRIRDHHHLSFILPIPWSSCSEIVRVKSRESKRKNACTCPEDPRSWSRPITHIRLSCKTHDKKLLKNSPLSRNFDKTDRKRPGRGGVMLKEDNLEHM